MASVVVPRPGVWLAGEDEVAEVGYAGGGPVDAASAAAANEAASKPAPVASAGHDPCTER